MTTVRRVSQCSSLCYSLSFSHKCPGQLMRVHDCNLMHNAKTRITMLITALHSGQLPPSSVTRRAQFSQNLVCPQSTKAKPSIGANKHTSQHRNGVSAAAGARRRRRWNCRRVGWAVARRCERQRRGSHHAGTPMCRTHHCAKSRRANVCIQSYTGIV